MIGTRQKMLNACVIAAVRPYTMRELPGWGRIYGLLVGGYRQNPRWTGFAPRWVWGKLHGYEMLIDLASWSNRETYFLGRFYDLPNQLLIKALVRPGETVVDIGANEGMISLIAAQVVGPGGKVISFEPNPVPRAKLEASLARNGIGWVDIRAKGLSDEPATLTLSVPAINTGEGTFGRSSYDADATAVQAEVRVGDAELGGTMPRFIKIDVEGFELHVLRGLRETLARARPLVSMEIIGKHLGNAGATPGEIAAELESAGYRGWHLSTTGRGAALHVELAPAENFGPDTWGDYLWLHRDDPCAGDIQDRLAGMTMARARLRSRARPRA